MSVLALLVTACSHDEDMDMRPVPVVMSLSTRAAVGQPADAVRDQELIASYRIYFVDKNGVVCEVVNNVCAPTELDEFSMEMAPGTYYVYAFANFPDAFFGTLGWTKGSTIAGFPNALAGRYYGIDEAFNTPTLLPVEDFGHIPMTSVEAQQVTVSERATQTFGIEVRRMLAKLEFVFTNTTDQDITVRGQSVGDITLNGSAGQGAIRLMNYDDASVQLSSAARTATLTHHYAAPLQLDAHGGTATRSFYVMESRADVLTNSFLLGFDVTQRDATPSAELDYMRWALTDPATLTVIRRNDWVRIPITFGEWQMHLEAYSYPPIGGYPEAEIDEEEGNEFVVHFLTPGEFSIRPTLRRYYDGSDWFGIDEHTYVSGTPTITVSDPNLIFLNEPSLSGSGEILGCLRSAGVGGRALVTISVDVITNPDAVARGEAAVTRTLTRKIYITQKA